MRQAVCTNHGGGTLGGRGAFVLMADSSRDGDHLHGTRRAHGTGGLGSCPRRGPSKPQFATARRAGSTRTDSPSYVPRWCGSDIDQYRDIFYSRVLCLPLIFPFLYVVFTLTLLYNSLTAHGQQECGILRPQHSPQIYCITTIIRSSACIVSACITLSSSLRYLLCQYLLCLWQG